MELTARGVWTMVHGMGFGALYLLACSGAMVGLWRHTSSSHGVRDRTADDTFLRAYLIAMAVLAWAAHATLQRALADLENPDYREHLPRLQPAWLALAAYYQAVMGCETLSDHFRAYAKERLDDCTKSHRESQSLPVPIDLTEGQLASDPRLEFLTCVALRNGQVYLKGT